MYFSILVAFASAAASISLEKRATTISVNLATKYQTIDGFGCSEAFQRANGIVKLAATQQRYALDLLFNTTNGAGQYRYGSSSLYVKSLLPTGFSILRNGIGSTPNSNSDYMNTILPTSPGSPSGTPKYVWDGKDSGQLFVTKEAQKYGVKTFYANAWSAPGFMKTNKNDANGGSLCGVSGASCSSGDWKQAFANYLVKYIQFYQQEGVQITHLGFLNEPDAATSYASMQSSGTQAADFIKVLYPTLQNANLSSVKVTCCDAMGYGTASNMLSQLSSVTSQLGLITSHAYTGGPNTLNTKLPVWMTELADNNGPWTTAWYNNGGAGEGFTWANKISDGITGANLSGYLYWIGAQERSSTTNSKLIEIRNGAVTPSKRLWAFAQFSRFVRPGAVRVSASGSGVKTSAYVNTDGSVAVVVINSGTAATVATINVAGLQSGSVKAIVTDNSHDASVTTATVSGGAVSGNIPARGMVSFLITA